MSYRAVWLAGLCLAVSAQCGGAEEKIKAVTLFNGNDLKGWKVKGAEGKSKWVVGKTVWDEKASSKLASAPAKDSEGEMVNTSGSADIYTVEKFGACTVEVEVLVPKGSNSGIYLVGEYEVQVIDSYGKKGDLKPGDMGGIYNNAAPKVNAAKKPGEWQKFVIDFEPAKFVDGKKVKNALFVKVTLNGEVIHENVEAKGSTGGGLTGKDVPTGPLMFQGDHGPIAFRNIKITPRDAK